MPTAARASKLNDAADVVNTFSIDCGDPGKNEIVAAAKIVEFLAMQIKVRGRKGRLGNDVKLSAAANSIQVATRIDFSKRYLKFLLKKYLKSIGLRDYLRIIANRKKSYILKFYSLKQQ